LLITNGITQKMTGNKHIDKPTLLHLLEECDEDTKQVFTEDYIPNWDNKFLWDIAPPLALLVDGYLACIVFYNYVTISDVTHEKTLYIQRTYTVPEFRRKGYFKTLIISVVSRSFNLNCRSMYMFCDVDFIGAWKKLRFVPLSKTIDKKYFFVTAPILCSSIEYSNLVFQNVADIKTMQMPLIFFTTEFLQFLKGTIAKYCQ